MAPHNTTHHASSTDNFINKMSSHPSHLFSCFITFVHYLHIFITKVLCLWKCNVIPWFDLPFKYSCWGLNCLLLFSGQRWKSTIYIYIDWRGNIFFFENYWSGFEILTIEQTVFFNIQYIITMEAFTDLRNGTLTTSTNPI
jgi:hypothetical protein